MDLLKEFLTQVTAVPSVWMPFCLALGILVFVVWKVLDWRYQAIIDRLRDERDSLARKPQGAIENKSPEPSPVKPPPIPALSVPPHKSAKADIDKRRVFVGDNITPTFLRSLYHDRTALHADQALAPYKDKWIKVSGTIQDVDPQKGGIHYVNIDHERPAGAPMVEQMAATLLVFQRNDGSLDVLHKGDRIVAIGKIAMVNKMGLTLSDCELTE